MRKPSRLYFGEDRRRWGVVCVAMERFAGGRRMALAYMIEL